MSKPLLSLQKTAQPFQIKSKSATKAEVILYGVIGSSFWEEGISAKQFSDEIAKLDKSVNEITLRINSPGGDVFDGITIYNRLKQHSAKIIVHIDGLAASIASIIALAGDEIYIGEGALYMVHLPWTVSAGNRLDLDKTVDRLMQAEEQMISIYAKKTKKDRYAVKEMLEAGNGEGTWMDADQAIENGFIDAKSDESVPMAASVLSKATWIKNIPKMKTDSTVANEELMKFKNKVEEFIARRKA